ncbi:MAG: LPS export ABC transporter periplasmic protein LptC [Calditrichia bacterium]
MKQKILIFITLLTIGLAGCGKIENEQQPTSSQDKVDFPDQESWNSTITITRDANRMAEVWAGYMALYNTKNMVVLKDSIHVDFFDKNGQHNSVLTADSGVVYNQTNNLIATGHVVVVSDSGIVLRTRELRWDNQRQKIISDTQVRFTTKEDTLIGDSFVSDPDLKNYEIRNAHGYSGRKIPLEK